MDKEKGLVKIVGIDESRIKQHSTNPRYIELPFKLTGKTDELWIGICVKECERVQQQNKRRMFITDDLFTIVVNMDDDLAEQKRIAEQIIKEANTKYSDLMQKTREQEEKLKQETRRNETMLAEFKDRAKKLFPQ